MNGSVVSSVTDKFGFMCEEGSGSAEPSTNRRTGDINGHSVHNDLEILRRAQSIKLVMMYMVSFVVTHLFPCTVFLKLSRLCFFLTSKRQVF
jgi:hypothetical protein